MPIQYPYTNIHLHLYPPPLLSPLSQIVQLQQKFHSYRTVAPANKGPKEKWLANNEEKQLANNISGRVLDLAFLGFVFQNFVERQNTIPIANRV